MFALLTVYFFSVLHPDADNVVLTLVLSPAEVSIHVYPVDSAAVQYQTRLLVLSMYSCPTTPTVDVAGGVVPMMGAGAFLSSSMRISLCAFGLVLCALTAVFAAPFSS